MAATITFDSDHTITLDDFPEGTPCTFEDIYDADVAGGWGIITKSATKTYTILGSIKVGDGSNACFFTDTNCNVTFSYAWASSERAIHFSANSVTQMGELLNGLGANGCSFMFKGLTNGAEFWVGSTANNEGDFLFYGGYMSSRDTDGAEGRLTSRTGPTWDFTDSIITRFRRSILYIAPVMTRTTFMNFNNNFYGSLTATDLTFLNSGNDLRLGNNNLTINIINLVCLPNPGTLAFANRHNNTFNLTNPDSVVYNVSWGTDNDPANTINYKFTFNLKVINIDGNALETANVIIKDSDGTELFNGNTNASGDITQQTLLYRIHKNDNGSITTTDFDPHTITVTKAGLASKTIKMTMDRKREDVLLLSPENSTAIYDSTLYGSTIY